MCKSSLKILDEAFASIHPSIGAFNHPAGLDGNEAGLALCLFLLAGRFRSQFEANLAHNLGIDLF